MARSPVIYTLPPGTTPQVPNTVISSAIWNTVMTDIASTFNTPQPIEFGGTAATSVIGGHDALVTKGANVATAATLVLSTATGAFVDLTGSVTVTSVTLLEGQQRLALAAADFQITVGASLIGNGGANLAVKAGDLLLFEGYAAGVVRFWSVPAVRGTQTAQGRNLYVNGSFTDSQERGDTLGTTSGYYPADQIALFFTAATAAMSVQRVQVRSLANALNQIEFKTTTAKAVLGANDFATLTQNIEGSSIAAAGWGTAAAIPMVMRFQFSGPAGLYHVHVTNSAANRHCSIPFTATGTAAVYEVVIPADTGGTWLTADGVIGATVDIVLAAGSSLTGGAASTWGATAFLAASTQVNVLSSTANVVRLADVGVKFDPAATGVYGAYRVGETDAVYRSERYVEALVSGADTVAIGSGTNSASTLSQIFLPYTAKCKVPTAQVVGTLSIRSGAADAGATLNTFVGGLKSANVVVSSSGLTTGQGSVLRTASSNSGVLILSRLS